MWLPYNVTAGWPFFNSMSSRVRLISFLQFPCSWLHAWSCHLRTRITSALLRAFGFQRLCVLSGNHHSVDFLWLHGTIWMLQVLNSHLSLAIWAQPPALPALAHLGESLAEACGHGVSQRHIIGGLVTGIAKHDALITSSNIRVVLANMHATSNVRAAEDAADICC